MTGGLPLPWVGRIRSALAISSLVIETNCLPYGRLQ